MKDPLRSTRSKNLGAPESPYGTVRVIGSNERSTRGTRILADGACWTLTIVQSRLKRTQLVETAAGLHACHPWRTPHSRIAANASGEATAGTQPMNFILGAAIAAPGMKASQNGDLQSLLRGCRTAGRGRC